MAGFSEAYAPFSKKGKGLGKFKKIII